MSGSNRQVTFSTIDYQEVHLQKLIITNDRSLFECYRSSGNVGLIFDQEVMGFAGFDTNLELYIIGILPEKSEVLG